MVLQRGSRCKQWSVTSAGVFERGSVTSVECWIGAQRSLVASVSHVCLSIVFEVNPAINEPKEGALLRPVAHLDVFLREIIVGLAVGA